MNYYEYYQKLQPQIRNFIGDCTWFLTAGSDYSSDPNWGEDPYVKVFPIHMFPYKLGSGPDIFRPIISNSGVLGVFDIEYSNCNKEVLFQRRKSIFTKQLEPVYKLISSIFGNEIIADVTWSGYHFLTDIKVGSKVYNKLLEIGSLNCLEPTLQYAYSVIDNNDIKRLKPISIQDGIVYNQFGRLIEFISHLVIKSVNCEIPITLCDTESESISLDPSQYGDPVFMRIIRTAFSTWDKHNINPYLKSYVNKPPLVDVIRKYREFELELDQVIDLNQDYEKSAWHHGRFDGVVPVAGDRILKLIEVYCESSLYSFHKEFDSIDHDPTDELYEMAKTDTNLPETLRLMLKYPNPDLLTPSKLKPITEALLCRGWLPKHIGGLYTSIYRSTEGVWPLQQWSKYDASTRANFWARIYSGLVCLVS
jgi:hypothetical protein